MDTQKTIRKEMMASLPVALFVPNILCYVRICMAFYGLFWSSTEPFLAVIIFIASAFLDLFDGILARALHQTSSLGILLDIAADNILRTCGWVAAAGNEKASPFVKTVAAAVVCVEWITMLSTQLHAAHSEKHWKSERENDPWFVRKLFSNNFRNPIGILSIYGLFSSGLWTFGSLHTELYDVIPLFDIFKNLAYIGRVLSLAVELWMIKGYLSLVIQKDSKRRAEG